MAGLTDKTVQELKEEVAKLRESNVGLQVVLNEIAIQLAGVTTAIKENTQFHRSKG